MSERDENNNTNGASSGDALQPNASDQPAEGRQSDQTVGETIQTDMETRKGIAELSEKRVRELALAEIKNWQAEQDANSPKLLQPKTWGKRTQLGAVAGSIVTVLATIFGLANLDVQKLSGPIHDLVGTDDRVQIALMGYSAHDAERPNPLLELVGRTMRQAPVLAFHGETTFGRTFEVTLTNRECQERRRQEAQDLVSAEFENLPLPSVQAGGSVVAETLNISEIDVEALCSIGGLIDFGLDLDIPFHARFFKNESSNAPPHKVWLVVFISRKSKEDDRDLKDQYDAQRQPKGVCFLYKPVSPAAGIESMAIKNLQRTGNGFWIANLGDSLAEEGVWNEQPHNPEATTYLHSLLISNVNAKKEDETTPSDDLDSCNHVEPVEGQIISVRAMVLVNKNASE